MILAPGPGDDRIDDQRRFAVERRHVIDRADDRDAWHLSSGDRFGDAADDHELGVRHAAPDARPGQPHEVGQSLAVSRIARGDEQDPPGDRAGGVGDDVEIHARRDDRNTRRQPLQLLPLFVLNRDDQIAAAEALGLLARIDD